MNDDDYTTIAAKIHRFYVKLNCEVGREVEFVEDFDALPETMKADNREAARRMGGVLALAGLRLVNRKGQEWAKADQVNVAKTIERNVDLLAEGEHDGWVGARLRNGWRLAPLKNVEKREHHLLVPWSEFPKQIAVKQEIERRAGKEPKMSVEEEAKQAKDYDRQGVRNYVKIIEESPYRIEPM